MRQGLGWPVTLGQPDRRTPRNGKKLGAYLDLWPSDDLGLLQRPHTFWLGDFIANSMCGHFDPHDASFDRPSK